MDNFTFWADCIYRPGLVQPGKHYLPNMDTFRRIAMTTMDLQVEDDLEFKKGGI